MIHIETIETSSLGDRSYLVHDGEVAVVVDPQRDIDRVLDLAAEHGVRITHVLETHVHNDYVTGGLELARTHRARPTCCRPAAAWSSTTPPSGTARWSRPGGCGCGCCTPPGTPTTTSATSSPTPAGAVRGGVHRRVDALRRDRPHRPGRPASRHRGADPRPVPVGAPAGRRAARGGTPVLPTHGFGSFCSATPTSGDASTVGEQARVNPALTLDEQDYVDTLLAGLDAYPAYYAHMGPINRRGPAPVDLSAPEPVQPAELRRRIEAGEWVVDLRDRTAFAAGHLAGSLGFELCDNFVTYLGWLYHYGTPLTLIGGDRRAGRRGPPRAGPDRDRRARRCRHRRHQPPSPTGRRCAPTAVTDFAGAGHGAGSGGRCRSSTPAATTNAPPATSPAPSTSRCTSCADRLDEVPEGEVWVYCGSGYRASIAASILDRARPAGRADQRRLRQRHRRRPARTSAPPRALRRRARRAADAR